MKILLVDDEPEFREAIALVLVGENYQVTHAASGTEALTKWRAIQDTDKPFDLVITDLLMPNMDGWALLTEIRLTAPLLPIVVLTGQADFSAAYQLLSDHQIADFHIKPIKNIPGLLFSVRNALEKAQMQQDLSKLNNELEQRVLDRTQQLQIETHRAKTANQAKSIFLSRMSHELRTPLNAILGFTQLHGFQLKNRNYDDLKDGLPLVLEAGRHLLRLVDDVLDLERSGDELNIAQHPCDLDSCLSACIDVVEQRATDALVTINITKTALTVLADEDRLKQIVVNLLVNAIKFNNKGGNVTVKAKAVDGMIELSVIDNGVGISEHEQAHIFEPFTRLKYADDSAVDGVGNGLAICKLLAVQMSGKISVKSTLGHGSEFILQLPAPRAQTSADEAQNHQLSKPTVLYVENDKISIQLVEMLFSLEPDIDLHIIKNPLEGIEVAKSMVPNLILLDINMPQMNGVEVMKVLRKDKQLANIPIVALSAMAMPAGIDLALAAGFTQYLTKPINVAEFMQEMKRLVASTE